MRGDEIADGKDVVDETRAWTLLCQTMSSLQVRPSSHLNGRADPSFTISIRRPGASARADETCFLLIASAVLTGMVEPDGIEPTTSCLQSTRSTN
jgi:hypothetical protein